jgi:hypothetical protein
MLLRLLNRKQWMSGTGTKHGRREEMHTMFQIYILKWVNCLRHHGFVPKKILTERRRRIVNTPAFYSGVSGFKFRSGNRLTSLRFFVVFFSPSRQMPYFTTPSFHSLSNSSFTYHLFFRRCIACVTEKASLKIQIKLMRCHYWSCLTRAVEKLRYLMRIGTIPTEGPWKTSWRPVASIPLLAERTSVPRHRPIRMQFCEWLH